MKKKKLSKKLEQNLIFGVAGVVAVIAVFVLVFGLSSPTGSAIYVEYHGETDELMSHQDGVKTYIHLTQPELKTIITTDGKKNIAESIAESSDIPEGLFNLYKNTPGALRGFSVERAVKLELTIEDVNMEDYLDCIRFTTRNNYNRAELKMVLVSELKLNSCRKNLWYAHTQHTFYNSDNGARICDAESDKLFLIDYVNNEISMDVDMC